MMRFVRLDKRLIELFIKLSFSAVFFQLLYISLVLGTYSGTSLSFHAAILYSRIPEMLENAAVTASCTLIDAFLLEYTLYTEGKSE